MKELYAKVLLVGSIVLCLGELFAQTVSNVTATQVGKTIHITYDLDKAADITLFLSIDGGDTYSELHHVTGDVGKTVGPGHKLIVWDVLSDVEELKSDDIMFKVRVDANAEAAWRRKHRKEVGDEKRESRVKLVLPYSTFFTLNAAYSPMPQWSCGFKVGGMKEIGWFVSVMSGFHYSGMYHPFKDGQIYALNGNNKSIRFSAQAGLVMRPCKPMSLLIGVGYGYRTLACQTTNNSWYCYPKRTFQGVDASLGFLFDIKGFALSAEAVTTNFKTIEVRVGLGFILPNKTTKN